MEVLKATTYKYNKLNGFTKNASVLQFIKDINNNWIVGLEVLNDNDFIEIRQDLQNLPKIEYLPKQTII
jgi:hypothetical protein